MTPLHVLSCGRDTEQYDARGQCCVRHDAVLKGNGSATLARQRLTRRVHSTSMEVLPHACNTGEELEVMRRAPPRLKELAGCRSRPEA